MPYTRGDIYKAQSWLVQSLQGLKCVLLRRKDVTMLVTVALVKETIK